MKEKQKNEKFEQSRLGHFLTAFAQVSIYFGFSFVLMMVIMIFTGYDSWQSKVFLLAFIVFFAMLSHHFNVLDKVYDDRHLIEDAEELKDIIDEVVEAQVEEKEKRHMR
jgi:ABC-type transport system involved in cytochrome bd biosynthesis fused ATPase/permease subunit